jgi:hypothetical protein
VSHPGQGVDLVHDRAEQALTRVAQHDLWRNQQREFVDDIRLDLERLDQADVSG